MNGGPKEVSAAQVLARVAKAVPAGVHDNIIIVGSLAAAYGLFGKEDSVRVRTKDVDCVLSPSIEAVGKGRIIAEKLIAAGWKPRLEGRFGQPGDASTPTDSLPAVRLFPPDDPDWFIELLTEPATEEQTRREWTRLELPGGHYGSSFQFTRIGTYDAAPTSIGTT